MASAEIDQLVGILARLPGLGPRSARRVALQMLRRRSVLLDPLITALSEVAKKVAECPVCGNLDSASPCHICTSERRDTKVLCVVRDVADLWALERGAEFRGRYHVLGGLLSALDGIRPEDLGLERLMTRIRDHAVTEVIMALPATVEGQTTAHVIADRLESLNITVSSLAQGVPVGGELDYLDDGTLTAALRARRPV